MAPAADTRCERRKAERPRQAKNRSLVPSRGALRVSALLFLDVLDHLGHVVLVLAELGCILEQLLVLLFRLFKGTASSSSSATSASSVSISASSSSAPTGASSFSTGAAGRARRDRKKPPGRRECRISDRSRARATDRSSASRSSGRSAWCPIRLSPHFSPSRFRKIGQARHCHRGASLSKPNTK